MKRFISLWLAALLFIIPSFAEETHQYPFGIPDNASPDEIAEILSPMFGEIERSPGFEDKGWFIKPSEKYLYGFKITMISFL